MSIISSFFELYEIFFYSGACIINDPTYPETYILTGGSDGNKTNFEILRKVQRYNLEGPIGKALPSLTFGRIEHGCSGYFNSDGAFVSRQF